MPVLFSKTIFIYLYRPKSKNRVCANSYDVEPFFKLITYGSLSHLAHHVEMHIPGEHLDTQDVIRKVEYKLGVSFVVKQGIQHYLIDIAKQFKGPVHIQQLNTNWIKQND